tara:strand:- start:3651 stop:4634 length:984 start_codon:yes stop_codon:yes gene_type:complete
MIKTSYGNAIRLGFEYVLDNYPESFVIGQGLWSPWYVGNTMRDLDEKYGKNRIIDTPVSEAACTGLAVGASLCGSKPIVVHPRIDFMLYAMDPIVNQAAKWTHMTGAQNSPGVTIRGIINRGGEQGAQHSQSLHAWFSHIPGLRVVMPYSVQDARDLLIMSAISKDPIVYIDDRWLYDQEAEIEEFDLSQSIRKTEPKVVKQGTDLTIVSSSFGTKVAMDIASNEDFARNISAEVIDLRVLSPLKKEVIINSVKKTCNLVVIDGGTKTAGYASEVITSIVEDQSVSLKKPPTRFTLPDSPAPTSRKLEELYYLDSAKIARDIIEKYA